MYETCLIRQRGQEGADWQEGQKRRQRMRKEVLKKFVSGKEEEGIGIYLGREKLKRWWKWGRWSWFYFTLSKGFRKGFDDPCVRFEKVGKKNSSCALEWSRGVEVRNDWDPNPYESAKRFLYPYSFTYIDITCLINCLTHIWCISFWCCIF